MTTEKQSTESSPKPEPPKENRLRPKLPKIFEPMYKLRARYKGAHGGRGSGKSHSFALLAASKGLRDNLRILCCREFQYSIDQSVKHIVEQKVRDLGMAHLMRSAKTYTILDLGGGAQTEFIYEGLHLNTSAIRSMENVDIAWVDEAQAISQRSLDDLIPTIRKDGSELWFSWNPHSPNDPVDRLLRGTEPPPFSPGLAKFYDEIAIVREVNYEHNEWFTEILRAEMLCDKRRDYARYQHIWEGKYRRHSDMAVFRNWRVGTAGEFEKFVVPGEPVPSGKVGIKRFYFGADWGYSIDPTVLVRCFMHERTLYVDYEVYEVGCEVDHRPLLFAGFDDPEIRRLNPHAFQNLVAHKQRLWLGIPQARKWPIIADSASPDVISYMKRHGFPRMTECKKGAGSVDDGIEFLQSFDIVVHPECPHTAEELANYAYKIDPKTDEVLPVLEDKDNHVIDALRYALEGTRHSTYNLDALAS